MVQGFRFRVWSVRVGPGLGSAASGLGSSAGLGTEVSVCPRGFGCLAAEPLWPVITGILPAEGSGSLYALMSLHFSEKVALMLTALSGAQAAAYSGNRAC